MSAISYEFAADEDRFSLDVPGDSAFFKVISAVPLVGFVTGIIQEIRIANKIRLMNPADDKQIPRLIRLIDVKNDYKVANIVRDFLSCALIVGVVALFSIALTGSLLTGAPLIAATLILTVFDLWVDFGALSHNNRLIADLEHGYRSDIYVK